MTPFAQRVAGGLERRGLTMRQLCRAVRLDPSFFSKVLAGKRSPPMEEEVLRRIAKELDLDAAELIVAAGRIPSEWSGLWTDRALFDRVNSELGRVLAPRSGAASAPVRKSVRRMTTEESPVKPAPAPVTLPKRPALSEELL